MSPTPSHRLKGIENLRGVAAVMVVLSHAAHHVDKAYGAPGLMTLFQAGHAGVDLFFVISGFIILFVHWPDIGRPERLAHYVSRRFTRIFPLYWVGLACTIAIIRMGGHPWPTFGYLASSAWLLPAFRAPIIGIAWTLQFELVFYVVFASLIVSRIGGRLVLGAWLALILVCVVVGRQAWLPGSISHDFALEFFVGMAAAFVLRRGTVPRPGLVALAGAALFAGVLAAESLRLLDGYATPARMLYGIPAAMMVMGIAEAERSGAPRPMAWLTRLGGASYSIYLFQFIFIGIVWQALMRSGVAPLLPHALLFAVLAAAAVVGGLLTNQWIERPLLRSMRGGSLRWVAARRA